MLREEELLLVVVNPKLVSGRFTDHWLLRVSAQLDAGMFRWPPVSCRLLAIACCVFLILT